MPRGFRSTRNGRKKASHVCQQFPEVHEMAAKKPVMHLNRSPGYMALPREASHVTHF